MRDKVLFVSAELPTGLGGVRRLYYNLQHFSREFEVHLIRVKVDGGERRAPLGIPKEVEFSEIEPGSASIDPKLAFFPIKAQRMARIGGAKREIQEYIDKNGIGAVVAFAQDCAFALRGLKARVKVAEALDSHANYYSSKAAAQGGLKARALGVAMPRLYRLAEAEYARSYDRVAYVSRIDFRGSAIPAEKLVLSFDVRDPPLKRRNLGQRKNDVAIIGRWEHPPNRDGLDAIRGRLGEIGGSVSIIGPGMEGFGSWPANSRALGFVDDIGRILSDTKVCMIPVWYGAGLQNKAFDALRYGCKLATTNFTRESLEQNGFMAGTAADFSDDVIAAAKSALEKYAAEDAKAAYLAYEKFQGQTVRNEIEYVACVKSLLSGRG